MDYWAPHKELYSAQHLIVNSLAPTPRYSPLVCTMIAHLCTLHIHVHIDVFQVQRSSIIVIMCEGESLGMRL